MNSEVIRLRKLRRVALKVRALSVVLRSGEERQSLYARVGVLCWRVARIASGQLRGHPYRSYQQGPSFSDTVTDGLASIVSGILAGKNGRRCEALLVELKAAAREMDDVRALTLTPHLSDALGRAQWDMRGLIGELATRACVELGSVGQRAEAPAVEPVNPSCSYLAL